MRTGAPWRLLPTNFPPWQAVYQQTRRWIAAGCFEAIVQDLRLLVRAAAGRRPQPSVAIVDSRTLRSTVESGQRAGVDGHKRVRGSKVHRVHAVVDTMGTLLALAVTPANEAERRQISALAQRVQEVTGESVELIYADAASTGEETEAAAQSHGMRLMVVQRPQGSHGFVLLPKRWVVEGTHSQYLQSALDVQTTGSHDRTRWVAEPAHRRQPAEGRSAGLSMCCSGSWCAMSVVPSESAPLASAPPRPRALSYAVGGSSCHGPIGNDSCTCSVASSNGS